MQLAIDKRLLQEDENVSTAPKSPSEAVLRTPEELADIVSCSRRLMDG